MILLKRVSPQAPLVKLELNATGKHFGNKAFKGGIGAFVRFVWNHKTKYGHYKIFRKHRINEKEN